MKGIIFTQFSDFISERFGLIAWQTVLDETALQADGCYVGTMTYPDHEFMQLFTTGCTICKRDGVQMQIEFGQWLFPHLLQKSPAQIKLINNLTDFLFSIDTVIHVEVKKLDPQAQTPSLHCTQIDRNTLCLDYISSRSMGYLAQGLIEGAANHFKQAIRVDVTPSESPEKYQLKVNLL